MLEVGTCALQPEATQCSPCIHLEDHQHTLQSPAGLMPCIARVSWLHMLLGAAVRASQLCGSSTPCPSASPLTRACPPPAG
jgi:hypothetical protein